MIDGWLIADRELLRKQRRTARRICQRLVAEHGVQLAEVTVSRYVAHRRIELRLDGVEVMMSQPHLPAGPTGGVPIPLMVRGEHICRLAWAARSPQQGSGFDLEHLQW